MKKNVLKQLDMIALADALREVCKKTPEGSALYADGWSDQRIVEESKGRLTLHNVIGMRTQLVGPLPRPISDASLAGRIARVEAWAAKRPVDPFYP